MGLTVADPVARLGAEKHEIYAAFTGLGGGMAPSAPPGSASGLYIADWIGWITS